MLDAETDDRRKSVLEYEIATLTEHKLADLSKAIKLYLSSYNTDSTFRPPLFALSRIFDRRRSFDNLKRIYESAIRVALSDSERASHLIDLGALLYDHFNDAEHAVPLLEQALDLDSSSLASAIILEKHYSATGKLDDIDRIIIIRASKTKDPSLKAALLHEVGRARLRQGNIEGTIEALRAASTIPQYSFESFRQLERFARAYDIHDVLVQALEGRATLTGQIAQEQQHRDESSEGPRAHFFRSFTSAEEARGECAALWRESARIRMAFCNDAAGAAEAYGQAVRIAPDDLVLKEEQLIASEKAGDLAAVAEHANALLSGAMSGRQAAALHFRLGEVAQAQGNIESNREAMANALKADPDSCAVIGLLDDSLIQGNLLEELVDSLESRANRTQPEQAVQALWRAGVIAADHLKNGETACRLLRSAAEKAKDRAPILRKLLDVAIERKAYPDAIWASEELLKTVSNEAERSALLWECFRIASTVVRDSTKATDLLLLGLDTPASRRWAADIARFVGAFEKNDAFTAKAHDVLAENAINEETAAAHYCAAARALIRAGDDDKAIEHLKRALEYSPANDYAISLLEEMLLARSETEEVVQLLRRAAEGNGNSKQGEIAFLYAGAVAESAGNNALAARNYEDAIDRDPVSLAPLWSLRRLGEQTDQSALLSRALQGLASRETDTGNASLYNLDLGIHRDLSGEGALAHDPLRAVLGDSDLATEAALSLLFIKSNKETDDSIDAARAHLRTSLPADKAIAFAREQLAVDINRRPERARQLAKELLSEQPTDRWAHYTCMRTASDAGERAQSYIDLGNTTEDRNAASVLLLHGLRCRLLAGQSEAGDDSRKLALGIAKAAPDSIVANIAMDETLAPGDDPESRADTLKNRLEHATDETRATFRNAYARALLAANRFQDAAKIAEELVTQDDTDLAAWEIWHNAAYALQEWQTVVRACDKMAEHCDERFKLLLLEETADIFFTHLRQEEEAEKRLRATLEIDPRREVAFNLLHDMIALRDDADALRALIENRIAIIGDSDEKIDLLYEASLLYRSTGDRVKALDALEEVLVRNSRHSGGLKLKAELHTSLKNWEEAITTLRRLAEMDIPLEQKRLARFETADLLEKKQADPQAAYDELEKVISEEPGDERIYAKMADLANQLNRNLDAASSYVLAAEKCEQKNRASYEKRAGRIFAEKLNDRKSALEAYSRALAADPTDEESCRLIIDLTIDPLARDEILETFESNIRKRLILAPLDGSLNRKMYRAALLREEPDMQLLTLQRLTEIENATPDEKKTYEQLSQEAPTTYKTKLSDASLAFLMPEKEESRLAKIARHVSYAAIEMRIVEPPNRGKDARLKIKNRDKNPVRDNLTQMLGIFGLKIDDFYVGGIDPDHIEVIPKTDNMLDWVAGSRVTAPFTARQRYFIGYQAMAARLSVAPLLMRGSIEEALNLIVAASDAVQAPLKRSGTSALDDVVKNAAHAMSRKTRKSLHEKLVDFKGEPEQIRTYCSLLHRSCQRAGLLFAGSLQCVLEIVVGDKFDSQAINDSVEAQQLIEFYTSRELLALRREIGIAR
jgi:tetratricopeptide (TPR) repeat protein